jgi:type I pantothenate kinase
VWTHVNLVNLREHILPARDRADVVFEQGPDHAVRRVCVRR